MNPIPNNARLKVSQKKSDEPFWYKDAIIYEVHVRAFADSNADGIGDLPGLTSKLDYLRDLGVTALWLLPFYPSPLKDDGYDIADYYSINPIYGTLAEFRVFLREAHRRNLRVITELVVNHTSDQHSWFQRARRAKPGSAWRDFYVWNDNPEKYKDARIIFRDFEQSNWSWDRIAKAYFWHRFYSHQPDLNYDNPQVHKEMTRALDFWLDMGVDGVRLDAVPYLYEREGTSCENLPETHDFLKNLRKHVDEKYGDRMLLAEANQWPEDAVNYFGSSKGDECHMAFHFPLMPRLFMGARMEDRWPIVDILEQTPAIPETSQWALFLRNHDELTLEMVTDEERDYMYRVYAHDMKARINLGIRRRLAPLLGNDRRKIELLNLLLLSLPGTPVLYYGDEIGMGENVFLGDRNGVRTPMQWNSDKNAGFSRASPQALYSPVILEAEYHFETVNVETQERNSNSLLWWTKRMLALRKRWKAFGQGKFEMLHPENRKILAFVRRYDGETILVVANLSRFPQPVELDLSQFKQTFPVELMGRTEFPIVTDRPYFLTLSPYTAFWFVLEPAAERGHFAFQTRACETISVTEWDEVFAGESKAALEACLSDFLKSCSWFSARQREIKTVQIRDVIPVRSKEGGGFLAMLLVDFVDSDAEEYLLPLAFASGEAVEKVKNETPHLIVAQIKLTEGDQTGIIYDAIGSKPFCLTLLETIIRRKTLKGTEGQFKVLPEAVFKKLRGQKISELQCGARFDQNNTSLVFGDRFVLKLFRRLEPGINPDLEVSRFLSRKNFRHIRPLVCAIEYAPAQGEPQTLGILSEYILEAKSGWTDALDVLDRYFERARTLPQDSQTELGQPGSMLELAAKDISENVSHVIGIYLQSAQLLGESLGDLHVALASEPENKDFAPEPFTPFYQRSLYQSMRNNALENLQLLRKASKKFEAPLQKQTEQLLTLEKEILNRLRGVSQKPIAAMRIRCHGDFHLGEVLHTGKDFLIIDFEGDPMKSFGERRIKRPVFRDIAAMIRSFHYAAHAALRFQIQRGNLSEDHYAQLQPWIFLWHRWISAAFLRGYLKVAGETVFVPRAKSDLAVFLDAHLLSKALHEIGYELKHRPDWVNVPIQGVLEQFRPVIPEIAPKA